MRALFVLFLVVFWSLILTGCATTDTPKDTSMSAAANVRKQFPPPVECTQHPAWLPDTQAGAIDSNQAAREYQRLKERFVTVRAAYKRCQRWVKE